MKGPAKDGLDTLDELPEERGLIEADRPEIEPPDHDELANLGP